MLSRATASPAATSSMAGAAITGAAITTAPSARTRSEYTAAKNYIRNGMYKEALIALSSVPSAERDGKWYYLSAGANMYYGNKVQALEHAKRAVELDPDNAEYRRLLEMVQTGRDFYDGYASSYARNVNLNPLWLACAAMSCCQGYPCCLPIVCC